MIIQSPTPKGFQEDEEFNKMDKKLYSSALSSYHEDSHPKDLQDKSIKNSPGTKSSSKKLGQFCTEQHYRVKLRKKQKKILLSQSYGAIKSLIIRKSSKQNNKNILKCRNRDATSSEEEEFNEDDQNIPLIAKLATAQFHKLSKIREKIKKQGDIESQDLILKQRAEKKKYQYVLSYRENIKLLWDAFIICLALIVPIMNSICVSLDPPFRRTAGFPAINLIVDFIFLLDMILIFRTSRLNFLLGEETNDPYQLALIYIKSYRFWVDILSIIPFEMFDDKDLLILFSMLKIFRIGRFNKILQNTNLISQSVGSKFYEIDDDLFKYATLIHYSVLMYLINETSPTVLYERQFVQVVAIISAIVNAIIFGNITVLVSELKKKENEIQENQDAASTAMTNLELPIDLRISIQTQMQVLQSTRDEPEELQVFLNSISASKRLKVQVCVMNRELRNNKLIIGMAKKKFDAFIEFMVSRMDLILSNPEDIIIKEGESLEGINNFELFLQKTIACISSRKVPAMQNKKIEFSNKTLKIILEILGLETTLDCKRQASVIAQNYSTLARLSYDKFKEVVQKYPKLQTQMKGFIKGYDDPITKFMTETLEKIPYYDYFDDDDRISIIYNFTMKNYQKGSLIQAQGEIPENLTIISRGVAQVFTTIKSEEFPLEYLCHGSIINQNMFLLQQPVQMPIKCITSVMVLNFSFEKLKIIRDKNSESNLNKELDILTKFYQKEGIEKIYLDYISPTPFNLQVDDIKYARRQELTRQLKNAAIQVLMNYRKKNHKVNFNDMLKDIIKKIKEQKRTEKQKASLLAKRISAGEGTELPAITGDQACEIHTFLNQMEKAVEFQKKKAKHDHNE
ncbi:UNKNOWN [Stylonychia lemnae]|uniref:Cyclic nucleotide-binding domain-containing protein n=1 Tax=Stylonychia lemnae TaxID=5949 RepID=A0A078AJE7_STYLE|nr:UNKNOWN [Stylonychia lemnae]|eukprot:CDW81607.1 UNKNOWN [Stylonychia lemnae]